MGVGAIVFVPLRTTTRGPQILKPKGSLTEVEGHNLLLILGCATKLN